MQMLLGATGFAVLISSLPITAESLPTRNRTTLFSSQLDVLDGRASSQYANSIRLQPPQVNIPSAENTLLQYSGNYRGIYFNMAKSAAQRNSVPEGLFLRLVQQESSWKPHAMSSAGAMGLAQLMPKTAQYLQVNAQNPYQNLNGGARYLREQYDEFGSWQLALAAYNAGPSAVKHYGGVPPYRETKNYIRIILGN